MAKSSTPTPVRLPLIDRLFVDPDPPRTHSESVRRLKKSLERDLEWLLNTRRTVEELPAGATEVEKSVYWFGLEDLNSLSLSADPDRTGLLRAIEIAIATFEPRLTSVKISLAPAREDGLPEVGFVIDGLLRLEPVPERVSFDTKLDAAAGKYHVERRS
jgi:type VI secretion system protein ImpF